MAICALSLCAGGAAYAGYLLGERNAAAADQVRVAALLPPSPDSTAAIQSVLDPSLAACPTSLEMCDAGRQALRESVTELTRLNASLREDLEFYRGMIGSESGELVRILRVGWYRLGPRRVVLRAVLVQPGSATTTVEGDIRFRLRGTTNGAVRELSVRELALGNTPMREFSLRRFVEWEAELRLPEGFEPDRLVAILTLKGQSTPVVKSWKWSELES